MNKKKSDKPGPTKGLTIVASDRVVFCVAVLVAVVVAVAVLDGDTLAALVPAVAGVVP